MSATSEAVSVLKDNRVAVVVLVGGGIVVALYVSKRMGDVVETSATSTFDVVKDVERKITATGVIGAAILIAALLLGAPMWAAFAATGVFLVSTGAGKLISGILARANGTGDGGISDAELAQELCKAHGGAFGILDAGGTKVAGCKDGSTFHLKAAS